MVKHLPNLDAARPECKVAVVDHNRHWRQPVKDAPVPLTRRIVVSHNPRSSWDWRCASIFDRSQLHLPQFIEQLLGIDEIGRIQALSEPGVDRGEQGVSFPPVPAVRPQAGKRG
jgi:hypothetical protein